MIMEAARILKSLGIKPKRTIRVVGWTNEENGSRGGRAYAEAHKNEVANHVLMIESDGGVFQPTQLGFSGSESGRAIMQQIAALVKSVGPVAIGASGGGADIGPMMQLGVPGVGFEVDGSRYFWFHHTDADTVDKLDPAEMQRCVAIMAVLAYIAADLPGKIGR